MEVSYRLCGGSSSVHRPATTHLAKMGVVEVPVAAAITAIGPIIGSDRSFAWAIHSRQFQLHGLLRVDFLE